MMDLTYLAMINNTPSTTACPVCRAVEISIFIEITGVPVHCNLLWQTREAAINMPKGNLRLGFCRRCGHIFNAAFDSVLMRYEQDYENSLHFSPRFQEYAKSLAAGLIERHDLRGKTIVEIGCGRGDFLMLLCDLGNNRGVGFDPSYTLKRADGATEGQITFIRDFYSERYADYQADLVCCRHVLEHIQQPRDFLQNIRRVIGNRCDTVVFFEVPDVNFTLKNLGIWDLIYEHCSYFSAGSLAHLFAACGFEVYNCTEAFAGQFLGIEAVPVTGGSAGFQPASHLESMAHDVVAFAERYFSKVSAWRRQLEDIAKAGKKVVVWGAGSKGTTFLNIMHDPRQIKYIVDINPIKQGKFVAGTGQKIVSPEFLLDYKPDMVIVMNPIYLEEIRRQLQQMDLSIELVSV